MRRVSVFALLLSLILATAAAAHERKETIHYPSLAGEASGYLALPASHGNHPAIIVIQEWWGLNDWVKEQADRFAAKGYVALAPDLYRGKVASDQNAAHELMRGLPHDRGVADLQNAFKYLATRKDVEAFEKALKAAGKSSDIKIYPGAGHAFMNPNNTQGYVKAAAEDAWKRIDAFLAKALKLS